MRFFIRLIVAVVMLVTTTALPVAAVASKISKAPVYHMERHEGHDSQINQVVDDLTWPWPFRRSHGDEVADVDSDGDGVSDKWDRCPETPMGATVDARGCSADSDRDGVLDGLDQCGNTPRGAKVDTRGCPMDSDGDGVFDGIDRCEGTAAGASVDDRGCPISKMETDLLDTGLIRASDILFERDSADLKSESRRVLNEIGEILNKWPELKIEISGHTDATGEEDYNEALSERRARAVKDYLLLHFSGLKADHLRVKGYGESRPVATNDTNAGRAENRRVEFKVLNEESLQRDRG
jgi:OOP family OmpA-OmpF porin